MPPLAKTIGIALLLAAHPGSLAAQSPAPSARLEISWPTDQGQAIPGRQTSVQPASYEEPVRDAEATHAPDAPAHGGLGLREPAPSPTADRPLPPLKKSSLPPLLPQSKPAGTSAKLSNLPSLATTGSALAIVLGLFFVFAWAMRRTNPGRSGVLPADIVEVLGRVPLAARQQMYLIRCGKKLVLVHVCPEGVEPLTEINEPEEVDRLLGLCRQTQSNSATAAFRQVFQQFAGESSSKNVWAQSGYDDLRLANSGIPSRSRESLEDEHV